MGSRSVTYCDRCKSEKETAHFSLPVESYTDAAGSSDTHHASFDICLECCTRLIYHLGCGSDEKNLATAKWVLKEVRDHIGERM